MVGKLFRKTRVAYINMVRSEFDIIWQDKTAILSAPDSYTLDFIEPPQKLAHLITTFFLFRSEQELIRDVQPANTGHMMIFLSGEGEARFASGRVCKSQPVSLIGPTNAAMQYVVKGPLTCFGCAFTPIGWRAVTNMSANDSCDRFIDSEQILGRDVANLFEQLLQLENSDKTAKQHRYLAETVSNFLLPRLSDVASKHIEIIAAVVRWLDNSITPDVDDLYSRLPVARRQAQRVIGDYFGCAPKQLMRKYRAVRAAMLLNDPACTEEQITQVQELFYDQPHMIREIRHFAGRTPHRISDEEGTLLSMWLDKDNIRELRQ